MRQLIIFIIVWSCTLGLMGCNDVEPAVGITEDSRASLPPNVNGYTFTHAETAVIRMQIAHLITLGQVSANLELVTPSTLASASVQELAKNPSALVRLKGTVSSYENSPDGTSVYLYFSEDPKGDKDEEELLSVAWLTIASPSLANSLEAGKELEIVCPTKINILNVSRRSKIVRFTNCVPLEHYNEMVVTAIAQAISQQAKRGEINEDLAPIAAYAINLAKDKKTMAECFSSVSHEIHVAGQASECAKARAVHGPIVAAHDLNSKGLKISSEKSTSYQLAAGDLAIFHAPNPVERALSYPMTSLEAKIFRAWVHNDIKHWIEISEAGEKSHPGAAYLPSYLGGLTLIAAKELEIAYYENEVAADLRFVGKRLLVHGKIGRINSGLRNKPSIDFSTGGGYSSPTATFQDPDLHAIAQLERGQAIRLICKGAGEVVGSPRLNNCEFANDVLDRILTDKVAQVKKELLIDPKMLADIDLSVYTTSVIQAGILPDNSICRSSEDLELCAASVVKTPRPREKISELRQKMVVRGAASAGSSHL